MASRSKDILSRIRSTSALTGAALLVDLGFLAVLSRLLSPADYGVVGAATILLLLFDLFRDIGIGTTLVQMQTIEERDERTAWTVVVGMSVATFICVQALAGLFADFMNIPEVEEVLRILSFVVLIQAPAATAYNLLLREHQAPRVIAIEWASKFFAYLTVGTTMAFQGFGYWSLVCAALAEAFLRSILLIVSVKPRMRPLIDSQSLKRLLGRGSGFTIYRVVNFIALRADVTIVGRYLDASSLGSYSRAYKLMSLPADLYAKIADRVVFPVFSRVQEDTQKLKSAYLKGTRLTSLIGLPLTAVLYLASSDIILFLLGSKWSGIIPIFSVLAVGTYFRLATRLSAAVLRATASIRYMVSSQFYYAILTICGCLIGVSFGVEGVAYAVALAITISYVIITIQTCRVAGVKLIEYAAAHFHGAVLALPVGALTLGAKYASESVSHTPIYGLLAIATVLGVFGLVLIFSKPRFLLGKEGCEFASFLTDSVSRRL